MIEKEEHIVVECSFYKEIREKFGSLRDEVLEEKSEVILFYMNKIPPPTPPTPPHFFPIFLLPLGMPIDSEIMDRF